MGGGEGGAGSARVRETRERPRKRGWVRQRPRRRRTSAARASFRNRTPRAAGAGREGIAQRVGVEERTLPLSGHSLRTVKSKVNECECWAARKKKRFPSRPRKRCLFCFLLRRAPSRAPVELRPRSDTCFWANFSWRVEWCQIWDAAWAMKGRSPRAPEKTPLSRPRPNRIFPFSIFAQPPQHSHFFQL